MSKSRVIARQGTFDTAPADTISGSSIKRGNIEIPLVLPESSTKDTTRSSKDSIDSNTTDFRNIPPKSTVQPDVKNESGTRSVEKRDDPLEKTKFTGAQIMNNNSKHENHAHSDKQKVSSKPGQGGHNNTKHSLSDSLSKRLQERRDSNRLNTLETDESREMNRLADTKQALRVVKNKTSTDSGNKESEKDSRLNNHTNSARYESMDGNNPVTSKSSDYGSKNTSNSSPRRPGHAMRDAKVSDSIGADTSSKSGESSIESSPIKLSPSRYKDENVLSPRDKGTRVINRAAKSKDKNQNNSYKTEINERPRISNRGSAPRVRETVPESSSARKETIEQTVLERNGLLRSEIAYKKRIKQLEDESKIFLEEAKNMAEENSRLQTYIDNLEGNNGDSKKENKTLLSRSEDMNKENQNLWEKNEKLKSNNVELENRISRINADFEEERTLLIAKEVELKDDIKSLHSAGKMLESDYKELTFANSELESKVSRLQTETLNMNSTIVENRKVISDLTKVANNEKVIKEDLKQSQSEVDRVRRSLSNVTKEMEVTESRCKSLESEKLELGEAVRSKSAEMFKMKDVIRKKTATISDLQNQVEHWKNEAEKIKAENEGLMSLHKEVSSLKLKIDSLQDELGKKHETVKKLKRELSEKVVKIEDLHRELANSDATAEKEADTFREKLAIKDENSVQIKDEINKKSSQISKLETDIFEATMKHETLTAKIRQMEMEKKQWENKRNHVNEIEDSNRRMTDENKRLRQLVADRNIEMTSGNSEKTLLSSRMEKLERKQLDSDIQVKQLQGWVSGMTSRDGEPPTKNIPKGKQKKPLIKRSNQRNKALSFEDLTEPQSDSYGSHSLPPIDKFQPLGYVDIYKSKLKLRKWKKLI